MKASHWMAAAAGFFALVAVEAVMIYAVGITTSVPKSQVGRVSTAVSSHLQTEWPAMRRTALNSMRPLMRREVNRMVSQVTIDVGGVRVTLPPDMRAQVAADINRLLESNLNTYFAKEFNPGQIISPALIREAMSKPLTVHLWIRALGVPMPVTIHLGGP